MSSVPLSSESGAAAPAMASPSPAAGHPRADARQWQQYLNRGLAENARGATPERASAPATALSPPPRQAIAPGAPLPRSDGPSAAPPWARTPAEARLAVARGAVPTPTAPPGEILPKTGEGLSPGGVAKSVFKSQVVAVQPVAVYRSADGIASALRADTMIAELSTARYSSSPTAPTSAATSFDANASDGAPNSPFNTARRARGEDFRPMRWMLPWLWQMSQKPVDEGEPIEWEVELPEGDRLRLHAVRHYGEWILDFAGSSSRLQRWIGQHSEDLGSRLQRIIGRPVHIYIDPAKPSSAV